VYVKKL